MLFSHVKISSFRLKAHLVFHWCLYNKSIYSRGASGGRPRAKRVYKPVALEARVPFTIFITFTSPKPSQVKCNIYVQHEEALYINTAVSFKSNITKIYYFWPDPINIFLKEHLYFGSPQNISV